MKTRIILFTVLAAALAFARPAAACNPPVNVAVSNISAFGATLTWGEGDSATTSYMIEYFSMSDTSSLIYCHLGESGRSFSFSSLTPNSHYVARISAICGTGLYLDTSIWE